MQERQRTSFHTEQAHSTEKTQEESNSTHELTETSLHKPKAASPMNLFISRNLYLVALAVRMLSVAINRTYFVADEYWQSTEVAHHQVFGYGYLTWEWTEGIRSYLYPFFFHVLYKALDILSLDYDSVVVYGPQVIQAFLSSFSDVAVLHVAFKVFQCDTVALMAYKLNLVSWFLFYTGSRTLSNNAEMCFSLIGLSYWPFYADLVRPETSKFKIKDRPANLLLALIFGGIALIIRPTAIALWIVPVLSYLLKDSSRIVSLIKASLLAAPMLLILSLGVDYIFHKKLIFVHWNFFYYNWVYNISANYGSHAWHWYLTQGVPVVLAFYTIPSLFGIWVEHGSKRILFHSVALYIFILRYVSLSCIIHVNLSVYVSQNVSFRGPCNRSCTKSCFFGNEKGVTYDV